MRMKPEDASCHFAFTDSDVYFLKALEVKAKPSL